MGRLWDSGRMGTSNTSSAAEQPATGSLNTARETGRKGGREKKLTNTMKEGEREAGRKV